MKTLENPNSDTVKRTVQYTLSLLAGLTALFILRAYAIDTWLFFNIDEISLLNQIHVPFLSGGSFSTSYFPSSILAMISKILFEFPRFRWLSVLGHCVTFLVLGKGLTRIMGRRGALVTSACFAMSWYFVYMGRIFEIASFTPFFAAVHFVCFGIWLSERQFRYLIGSLIFMGLGLSNHSAPWVYYVPFCILYIMRENWGRNSTSAEKIGIVLAFLVSALPFIYTVLVISSLSKNLDYLNGFSNSSRIFLVNFWNPSIFLRTFTTSFTGYYTGSLRFLNLGFSLLMVCAPVFLLYKNLNVNPKQRFFFWSFISQVGLILFSPFVPNNEGHLSIVLLSSFILLGFLVELPFVTHRWVAVGLSSVTCLLGFEFFFQIGVPSAQVGSVVKHIESHGLRAEDTLFSEGAWLKILHSEMGHELMKRSKSMPRVVSCPAPKEIVTELNSEINNKKFQFIFLTTECEELMKTVEGPYRKVWQGDQTFESHLHHGMSLYTRD